MLWLALTAAVCSLVVAGSARADVTVTPAGSGYDIDVTGQASASELLDAIASATGASIKGQPEDATLNANQLRGTSMERALRKLLPGAAFAVRYGDDGKPSAIIFLSPDSASTGVTDNTAGSDGTDGTDTGDDTQGTDDQSATEQYAPDQGTSDGSGSGSGMTQPAQ